MSYFFNVFIYIFIFNYIIGPLFIFYLLFMLNILLLTPVQFNDDNWKEYESILKNVHCNWLEKYIDDKFLSSISLDDKKWVFIENIMKTNYLKCYIYNDDNSFKFSYDKNNYTFRSQLIIDEDFNLLILSEISTSTELSEEDLIKILDDRQAIKNLWISKINNKIENKFIDICEGVSKSILWNQHINSFFITSGSNWPMIISDNLNIKNPKNIFLKDEKLEKISEKKSDGWFFHLWWNYGLSLNNTIDFNSNIVSMLTVLQMNYYKIRFYKLYFRDRLRISAKKRKVHLKEIKNLNKMTIIYHNILLTYKTLKSSFPPKIHAEFCLIESKWNIDDDLVLIDHAIVMQESYLAKQYQINAEITNKYLNYSLSFIAFIQITSIYWIFLSAMDLINKDISVFNMSTYLIVLILSLIFMLGIFMFKNRK